MNGLVSRRRRKLENFRSEGSCGLLCLDVEATKGAYQRWMDQCLSNVSSALFGDEQGFWEEHSRSKVLGDGQSARSLFLSLLT